MGSTNYTYTYNHKMQRVGKNWAGNDRDYVYSLGGQLLHETLASGNQDYVWLNGELIGVVTSATPASTKYLAALDQIGTPTRLYGSDGKPKWAADYEAFGKATTYVPGKTYAPSVEMNIRFPGQYFDAETGMHYNWYRYYDPNSGRYLQADPLAQTPGWAQPIFAYAMNSPLVFNDPRGQVVRLCRRVADIPGNPGFTHHWITTNAGAGGMGACNGGVPGHGGPDSPYGTQTCSNDHGAEPTSGPGIICEIIYDVDEACVNAALLQCQALGSWTLWNQCQSFAADILNRCRKNANSCSAYYQ